MCCLGRQMQLWPEISIRGSPLSDFLVLFARGAVSWPFKLQKCIALSTIEAEYVADNMLIRHDNT